MNGSRIATALVGLAAVTAALAAEPTGWTLQSLLKQLDKTSGDFKTAVADVEMTVVESAEGEARRASGKAYFSRDGSARIDLTDPEARTLLRTGEDLWIYEPARALVEHYPVGKYPERHAVYTPLGFSLTGNALSKDYIVGLLGEEVVDDEKTLHLELTPKSDEVRAKVSKIQLWIEERSWLPIRQTVFHTDANHSVSARYLRASRNVPVDDSVFKPKWPKGTETVKR
jgi:outer membrane lipoprotein-sorting protein